jgi:hypothetical protein
VVQFAFSEPLFQGNWSKIEVGLPLFFPHQWATMLHDLEVCLTGDNTVTNKKMQFAQGNVVCYRSVSRVTIPDPPFCWWPGCINGPRNRGRLEHLRDELGWVPLETDEDKHWVPLLLH